MSAFEFLFSFYGLLLGLTLVEVVSGFSRALDARTERPLGLILPLLTGVMIMDIATQWGSAWRDFREVEFSFRYLVAALFMTLAYYFSATQLFPRERSTAQSLGNLRVAPLLKIRSTIGLHGGGCRKSWRR